MRPKVLIDLDVITTKVWDRRQDTIEFLDKVKRGEYMCTFPLFLIVHILRKWAYKKLVDKIIREIDEVTTEFLRSSVVEEAVERKTGMPSRVFIKKGFRKLDINKQDFTLVVFASVYEIDFLVTYNKTHLLQRQEDVEKFLRKFNLKSPKIISPNEL